MSEQHDNSDGLLERATAALRDTPVPPGPPADVLARVLGATGTAPSAEATRLRLDRTTQHRKRVFVMRPLMKFAAAAAIAVVVAGVLFWNGGGNGNAAFAEVLQNVRSRQAVRFKIQSVVHVPNQPPQTHFGEVTIAEPSRMRQTMPSGGYAVYDFAEKKVLTVDPAMKRAVLIEMTNVPEGQMPPNVLAQLRTLDPKKATPIGEKQIDGKNLQGFEMKTAVQEMRLWVDPQTRLPVRMEMTMHVGTMPKTETTMTEFDWNARPDEVQMGMTPPAGFELQTLKMDMSPPTEGELIHTLLEVAESNGKAFPDEFTMVGVMTVMAKGLDAQKGNAPGTPEGNRQLAEAMTSRFMKVSRGLMFVGNPTNGADWHYAGKGVKLEEKDRPILWYRVKDKETYRVIHADLSVKEVLAAEVPKIPSEVVGAPAAPAAPR